MKRLLMIAFHFPPQAGSSGIQRTLRFARHLPDFGWEPLILSAHPRAYEQVGDDLSQEIPANMVVRRAFALDTARHLSIGKRYIGAMARPDRWVSWKFDAIRQGLSLIREFRPDALWSTYPIATAHLIGAELSTRSELPWIADFRDPMAQEGFPADPKTWKSFKRVEEQVFQQATTCVFTTPGAARLYRARYPHAANRVEVIENGYDEESFASVEKSSVTRETRRSRPITLLHSGIVYPSERDPSNLFEALGHLARENALATPLFRIRFRAPVHDKLIRSLAAKNGVEPWVECLPAVSYREALAEMLTADGLLVLQASNCNEQIPAKLYEYLRAGLPILALTDPVGDTADLLRRSGLAAIAPLDDTHGIHDALLRFVHTINSGECAVPDPLSVKQASREHRALQLSVLLNRL